MVAFRRHAQGEFVFIIRFSAFIATLLVVGIFWSVAHDDYYSDYSLLNWAPPRRLELVHIARTGGTEMAHEALRHGHSWGVCHFGDSCPGQRNRWTANTPSYHHCPWHHVPSQYLDALLPETQNPYHGADRFVVVRNVYDRLISEYYSQRPDSPDSTQTVTHFNHWVQQTLNVLNKFKRGDMAQKEIGNQEYFTQLGHLIPQYDYVYENGKRVVQHVLRYENLRSEFKKLMVEYQLPMRMAPPPQRERALTAYNLTKVNLIGIEMIYEDDFREWGYEIMSSKLPDSDIIQTQHALAKEHNNYVPTTPKSPIPLHWIRKGQNATTEVTPSRLRGKRQRIA